MELVSLLGQSRSLARLSFITRHADHELARVQETIEHKVLVDGRADVEANLGRLLAVGGPVVPKTLDLIGHSTPAHSLLMLGDWVIDTASSTVTAFFRGLAEDDVLPRLGVHALRLLGCQTADSGRGRATICKLADILELEVYGTTRLIYSAHYTRAGFSEDSHHVLVGATDLRRSFDDSEPLVDCERYPRTLDIDALPATPLIVREHSWPRRVASTEAARQILRLVRREEGAQMPGLLTAPSCEVALPAARPSWYHLAQVLLDGQFIRVYPDGHRTPGVVYPVDDPHALRAIVEGLPSSAPE